MIIFPEFDPVAIQIGALAIRWYGLAYVAAMLGGLWLCKRLVQRVPARNLDVKAIDDAFVWIILGVVAGGRLGYVLFYNPLRYLNEPLDILKLWEGGMSFHGGVLGVVLAMLLFAWQRKIHPVDLADRVVPVLPLGLFLGRMANFINGELWGRVTTDNLPWAMIFPHVDMLPRHPSQLYEAGLEGLLLGFLLWLTVRNGITRWVPSGVFLSGYALARIFVELFRTPEITHTFFGMAWTQGQLLSLPMLAAGLLMLWWGSRGRP